MLESWPLPEYKTAMITFNSNEEAEKYIKDGVLEVDDDIEIAFDGFVIEASLKVKRITSKDYPRNISAWDISAWDISAGNIIAGNIIAGNIIAGDISAGNISAGDISAWDISYFAFCISYKGIKCFSIEARRSNGFHKVLDGEIVENQPSKEK